MLDDGALMSLALCRPQEGQIVPRLSTLALYTLAHAGKTLFWVVSDLYFVWIVTAVGGVSGARAGLGIGLSILLAAGADYLGGRWLGRGIATLGGHARVQLRACLATALALLVFAGAGLCRGTFLATGMMAALILFRLTYAGVDITQNAVPALIARTAGQQADYAMWRNIAGGATRILLSATFVPLLAGHAPAQQAWRFLALAMVIGMAACLAAWRLAIRLADTPTQRLPPAPYSPVETGAGSLRLLVAMGLASVGMTVFQQLEPFLALRMPDVAGGPSGAWAGTLFLTCGGAGGLLCQPLWRAFLLRRGPAPLRGAVIAACLIEGGLMLCPLRGTAARLLWSMLTGLLYGACAGGVLLALWARINASLPRDALARISCFSAGAKLGQAIGLALAGWQIQGMSPSAQSAQPAMLTTAMALSLLPMMAAMLLSPAVPPDPSPV